tara:strand:+ start:267 stop:620 length:354 start_codon:yes stop_codon:yes gene_type:complete
MDENEGAPDTMWRHFNRTAVMQAHNSWGRAVVIADNRPYGSHNAEPCTNSHKAWMDETIGNNRTAGNAGYTRAIAPFWDARDIAFFFFGVSCEAASIAGYEAMAAHYGGDAPAWAWW